MRVRNWLFGVAGVAAACGLVAALRPRPITALPAEAPAIAPTSAGNPAPPEAGSRSSLPPPKDPAISPEALASYHPLEPKTAEELRAFNDERAEVQRDYAQELIPAIYDDVMNELAFSPQKSRELRDLLIQHSVEIHAPDLPFSAGAEEEARYASAQRARHAAEIRTLLGPRDSAAFEPYLSSHEMRAQVVTIGRVLESELPMSETQRRQLLGALQLPSAYIHPRDIADGEAYAAYSQEDRARSTQNDQALLQAARPVLDPAQLAKIATFIQIRRMLTTESNQAP